VKDLPFPVRLYQLEADGLESQFAPLEKVETAQTNLPPATTPLLGRERELDDLSAQLAEPDLRLLTLTGAGGVGKTKLAVETARRQRDRFPQAVFLVRLAPSSEPDLVAATVAQALGLRTRDGVPPLDEIAGYLQHRRALLLLDNFEQVADAAPLLQRLLETAPDVKLLVTSRVRLRLSGERILRVSPLSTPTHKAIKSMHDDANTSVHSTRQLRANVPCSKHQRQSAVLRVSPRRRSEVP
jgi:hypothetical protein